MCDFLGLFSPVRGRKLRQGGLVDRVARHHGDANRCRCPNRCGALAALEQRTLAQQRAGADLGDLVAVDLDVDDTVEEQEELVALRALGYERLSLLEVASLELLALAHDRDRELTLELRLDGGRERRRVLLAPWCLLSVRLLVPLGEVDRPGLLNELARVVIEPVARERARTLEGMLAGPVRLDRQPKRRPCGGGLDPEERLAADPPRRRQAHVTSGRLRELDPAVADLWVSLQKRVLDGRKHQLAPAELDPGDADVAAARIAVAGWPAVVVELGPRAQLICLSEGVRLSQRVEVLHFVRWRIVVVGHAHLERQLRHARDHLGRNPGDRRYGLLDSHCAAPLS